MIFQSQYPPEQCPPVRIEPTYIGEKQVGILVVPLGPDGMPIPPEKPEKPYSAKWNGIPLGGVRYPSTRITPMLFDDSGVNKSIKPNGDKHISIWDKGSGSRLSWDVGKDGKVVPNTPHWTEKNNDHHQGFSWNPFNWFK